MVDVDFRGEIISREHILRVLRRFDEVYPDTNAYDNWLDKGNYRYALSYGGKLYPPKYILSQASGESVSTFSGGEQTKFDVPVRGGLGCGSMSEDTFDKVIEPLGRAANTITLHKRGRSYHVTMEVGEKTEEGNPVMATTDKLTSLRAPGELAIAIGKWDADAPGELLLFIDSVEIVTVSE